MFFKRRLQQLFIFKNINYYSNIIKNKILNTDYDQYLRVQKRNEYYTKNDFETYNKYLKENNFPIQIAYHEGKGRRYVASRDIQESEVLLNNSKPYNFVIGKKIYFKYYLYNYL
jgi:hypothetical protein